MRDTEPDPISKDFLILWDRGRLAPGKKNRKPRSISKKPLRSKSLMSQDERIKALMAAFHKTTYCKWMASQNIPVIDGYGLEDVRDIAMAPWARTGGKAAFLNLYGMEGVTGMYVGEIPAGGALEAEKHFYEEVICILDGQGATEVWQEGGRKQMFEWGPGRLFAPPLNTWHRLINGGCHPVKNLSRAHAP